MTKAQRLAEVSRRPTATPPVASHDGAYKSLCDTIDSVEDESTNTPNAPIDYLSDGRIYPPQMDDRELVKGRPDLERYPSKGHHSYIGENGAITIATKDGAVVFDEDGADGNGNRWGTSP